MLTGAIRRWRRPHWGPIHGVAAEAAGCGAEPLLKKGKERVSVLAEAELASAGSGQGMRGLRPPDLYLHRKGDSQQRVPFSVEMGGVEPPSKQSARWLSTYLSGL